jgi:tRNA(Ile)-lysidine synthase
VEVEAYLRGLGQGWREDESNADVAFTRNRVRHELLPLLRSFNPEVERALANLAEIARGEEERWSGELARLLPQVLLPGRPARGGGRAAGFAAMGGGGVAVEIARLHAMDRAMQRRVVRAAARAAGGAMRFDETERVLRLAGLGGEQKEAGKRLELHGGLRVERTARELRFFQ